MLSARDIQMSGIRRRPPAVQKGEKFDGVGIGVFRASLLPQRRHAFQSAFDVLSQRAIWRPILGLPGDTVSWRWTRPSHSSRLPGLTCNEWTAIIVCRSRVERSLVLYRICIQRKISMTKLYKTPPLMATDLYSYRSPSRSNNPLRNDSFLMTS